MIYRTFQEYVARRDEGLLTPDKPSVTRMPKINPFPATQARLKRTLKTVVQPPPEFGQPVTPKVIPTIPSHLGLTM
jgi:hypothetical protein